MSEYSPLIYPFGCSKVGLSTPVSFLSRATKLSFLHATVRVLLGLHSGGTIILHLAGRLFSSGTGQLALVYS